MISFVVSVLRVLAAAPIAALALLLSVNAWAAHKTPSASGWTFAVSGDSRNCGNVIMPSIAAGAQAAQAAFYWHLGDLRAVYDFDEDYKVLHPKAAIFDYERAAWPDFERSQIEAFGDMPFFLGIGNHETVAPKTREDFTLTFADWLDAAPIRDQRLRDDPHDHQVRTYYHWIKDGIDFINLDNATSDQFDAPQMKWIAALVQRDLQEAGIRAVVVGMHEALPESIARGHSMSDSPTAESTGAQVYALLLELKKKKPVYILASHSHYVMEGIFDTPYWRDHGGVLYGWIIGTGGAYRYALPPASGEAKFAKTHVYGYLLATVSPPGVKNDDPVWFEFKEVTEAMTTAAVLQTYGSEFVHSCHQGNAQSLN